ncbi:MAG: cytochrome P450 [bacterium]|nr:cytochrome P450 [bacterium]
MAAAAEITPALRLDRPIDLASRDFLHHKEAWYARLRDESPVADGRVSLMRLKLVSRYEDCRFVLTDPRFVRNRARSLGRSSGGALPIPLPKAIAALTTSMIYEDEPEHRRHRNLVNQAFTARRVAAFEPRVEAISSSLLDSLEAKCDRDPGREIDLLEDYARWVPMKVIAELVGIRPEEAVEMESGLTILSRGLSGPRIVKTMLWDLRRVGAFIRELIERKRKQPSDDLLSALIEAEEDGDRLTTDELVAMVFLLIIAGLETTEHLITNGIRFWLESPDVRARVEGDPDRWPGAMEELVRLQGPVLGTKPVRPMEDLEIAGTRIARGTMIMPMLGAANRDPAAFDDPLRFDETRSPNPHLGFGFGAHFCLGKQLALMEARIGLRRLFERFPEARFGRDPGTLELANWPGWHRHVAMPVVLR